MRILLAEDSPVYRHLIGGYLRDWNFEFEVVRDGAQAWTLLEDPKAPALVLLDWVLPHMDGIELCRKIRERSAADRYIYIILLTAKSNKKDLVVAMQAGADDYLVKPFDAEELKARLIAGKRILDLHKELVSAREALRVAATRDFLTRLWNRSEVMAFLERELIRSGRESKPVGIVLLDIDHFKKINDTFGHGGGDAVLKELARLLLDHIRVYDGVGRYGGEEFLLVLPGCELEAAAKRAEEIRRAVATFPFPVNRGITSLTISMGITVAHHASPSTMESLLQRADEALYRAKNSGRNRIEQSMVLPAAPADHHRT
jgi:diguanylate cyclase (GGDEF)-like protein